MFMAEQCLNKNSPGKKIKKSVSQNLRLDNGSGGSTVIAIWLGNANLQVAL